MSLSFELVIECSGSAVAKNLERVLAPDNRSFPNDQRFSAERRGRVIRLRVEGERTMQAVTTIASLAADALLFQEIWELAA